MLNLLDVLIRDVLVDRLPALITDDQVRFQPPDVTLRTDVVNLNRMVLDAYLVDLREHRRLRTNESLRTVVDGVVSDEPAPTRMACHYLLSAWSPAQLGPGSEPALDEHRLLYDAAAALLQAAPLNPSRFYAGGAPLKLAAWPLRFRDADFPTELVPPEGFAKLSDFWSTMGSDMRWKPVLHLIITLPIAMQSVEMGSIVTTTIAGNLQRGRVGAAEVRLSIGGEVRHAIAPNVTVPVEKAWVGLETLTGEVLRRQVTKEDGRFTFDNLEQRQYRIRSVATGLGVLIRVVDVPSNTGEYDIEFP